MLPTTKTTQIGRNHGGAGIARSSICCATLPGRRRQTTDRRNGPVASVAGPFRTATTHHQRRRQQAPSGCRHRPACRHRGALSDDRLHVRGRRVRRGGGGCAAMPATRLTKPAAVSQRRSERCSNRTNRILGFLATKRAHESGVPLTRAQSGPDMDQQRHDQRSQQPVQADAQGREGRRHLTQGSHLRGSDAAPGHPCGQAVRAPIADPHAA